MKKTALLFFSILLLCVLVGCNPAEEPAQTDCIHTNTSWIINIEPTCLKEGDRYLRCNDCGQTIGAPELIPATGHKFIQNQCTFCDSMNIRDIEGLKKFAEAVEGGQSFADAEVNLLASIDLDGASWIPIGAVNNRHFAGTFNGNGYKITDFTISPEENISNGNGFMLKNNGTIRNLTLENVTLQYQGESLDDVGLLVGTNNGILENCHVSGLVKVRITLDWCHAGGLVGINDGALDRCSAKVSLDVRSEKLEKNLPSGCIVGGLAGKNLEKATVTNCFATGDVRADGWGGARAGGLIGGNSGGVTNCYASGEVSAATTASVDTFSVAGGLLGNSSIAAASSAKVSGCFASGKTTATGGASSCSGTLVGLVPTNNGQILNCYRLADAPSASDAVCELGKTATKKELQTQTFVNESLQWDSTVWVVPADGYAIFRK